MADLILPRDFDRQPRVYSPGNKASPLFTPTAEAYNLPASNRSVVDPSKYLTPYNVSGIKNVGGDNCVTFNGSSTNYQAPVVSDYNLANGVPRTYVFRLATVTDSAQTLFSINSGSANNFFAFFVGNNVTSTLTDEIVTFGYNVTGVGGYGGGVGWCDSNRSLLFDGKPHTLQITTTGTEWRLWLDGVQRTLTLASGATNNGRAYVTPSTSTLLGARDITSGTKSLFFNGDISQFYFAPKDLSWVAKEIHSRPWKLFAPKKRILYFDAPSFPVLSSLAVSEITSSGARLTAN